VEGGIKRERDHSIGRIMSQDNSLTMKNQQGESADLLLTPGWPGGRERHSIELLWCHNRPETDKQKGLRRRAVTGGFQTRLRLQKTRSDSGGREKKGKKRKTLLAKHKGLCMGGRHSEVTKCQGGKIKGRKHGKNGDKQHLVLSKDEYLE